MYRLLLRADSDSQSADPSGTKMSVVKYVPDFIRERYTRKFALIGLVVILLVSGVGLAAQDQVSERLLEEKTSTVQTNAELEGTSFGAWLQGQKQQTRTLSNHRSLQSDKESAIRSGLNDELGEMAPEVVELHYVNRDTETITVSTDETVEGQTVTTNESIEGSNLPAGQVFWNPEQPFDFENRTDSFVLESFVYKEEGNPSVALASPVPDSNHVVISVVRTNVRAEQFSSSIDGTRTVAIGGFTGLVLFSEDEDEVLTPYRGETNTTVEQRVLSPNVSNTGAVETENNIVGYASVPGTDWVVIKEAPKSEALALQADVGQSLAFLIGTALLGLICLTAVTALGPMRSLRTLADEARTISNGNFEGDIKSDGRIDEVGQVRSAFQETKSYLETATAQSDALATQEFDNPVLEETVPGPLGESIQNTRQDLEEAITELKSARKRHEVAKKEAEQRAESLTDQATEHSRIMQQVGQGNMTQRMEGNSHVEPMNQIAIKFNGMMDELEKTVGQLQSYVDNVETAGEEVEQSAETIRKASEQVAELIQRISDDAYKQKEQLQELSEMIDTLISDIQNGGSETDVPVEQFEDVAVEINEIATLSQEMMADAENVAGAAEQQAAELNGVSKQASYLQRYTKPLRKILENFEAEQEHEFVFSGGPSISEHQSDRSETDKPDSVDDSS